MTEWLEWIWLTDDSVKKWLCLSDSDNAGTSADELQLKKKNVFQ